MCVFVSRPMKIVTFFGKTITHQNGLLIFLFRNKIMEIVEEFDETSYNNTGKPWKSSRILRVKSNVFHFPFFFHHFFNFFKKNFHFFIFSFSFIFWFFLTFFILAFFLHFFFFFFFFHFLCLWWVLKIWFFSGPQFRYDFFWQFLCEKSFFWAHLGRWVPLWALVSFFFLLFFSRLLTFLLLFNFSFFLIFCSFLHFLIF